MTLTPRTLECGVTPAGSREHLSVLDILALVLRTARHAVARLTLRGSLRNISTPSLPSGGILEADDLDFLADLDAGLHVPVTTVPRPSRTRLQSASGTAFSVSRLGCGT